MGTRGDAQCRQWYVERGEYGLCLMMLKVTAAVFEFF